MKKNIGISFFVFFGLCCSLALYNCNGGDDVVKIATAFFAGIADDNIQLSPIVNAECRFVNGQNGQIVDSDTTDSQGAFNLEVNVGLEGTIECSPPGLANLIMNTFATSVGRQSGESVVGQDVTPETTVVNRVINESADDDPESLKTELLDDVGIRVLRGELTDGSRGFLASPIKVDRNNNLALLVLSATAIFNEMRDDAISSVSFDDALEDYFTDGIFGASALEPLQDVIDDSLNDPQNIAVLGTSDVTAASRTGAIQGTVLDSDGNPVAGATVSVTGQSVQPPVSTTTDQEGAYSLETVRSTQENEPFASFFVTVTASANGFLPEETQAAIVPLTTTVQNIMFSQPTPAPAPEVAPDLVITSLIVTGDVDHVQDEVLVPVETIIRNQGNAAADTFKVAIEYTGSDGSSGVAPFQVPGQNNQTYPFTSEPLSARNEVVFSGTALFPNIGVGELVSLTAIADSCSGDEFQPSYCRVQENREDNNRSSEVDVTIPPLDVVVWIPPSGGWDLY